LLRERIAYAAVAQRDTPLARPNQLDSTYYGSVPNRGAMFWRLVDRRIGHDAFLAVLKGALESAKSDPNGLTLAALRAAVLARGAVPVVVHLLAPNQRPVQMTSDLSGFWQRLYPQVRKELSRRYPKHAWPENPLT